ncbi:MMPL family transporter [Nocardia huaxiensis]|uniref:MMPL family transporter n=1 Tax=Nocardia huaxiensis TaxID=2755382 RepID=UPI001E3C8FEA|nr:MMPL family transporter [Nocardia huaxiensis]UFS94403.1 MMPL family transporter [Nocardia huaxiensis]
MFTRWGDLVYRLRYTVLGVTVAAFLGLGYFGLGVNDHLSSSGWFDPTSESVHAAILKDQAYSRDHNSDVVLLYTAPDGKTVDDPAWNQKIIDSLNALPKQYPQISKVNVAPWKTETGQQVAQTVSPDRKHAFATVALNANNDTEMLQAYAAVQNAFTVPGVQVEVGGLQPIAYTLNNTIASDVKRMEMLALPAVAVLLFFIFGGVVAAALPLIIGGLTIIAANGMIMALTKYTEVNSFVSAVVSMIGLGLAIDYGLFIVSRFREELAEGYDTKAAVRRSVMTAGRTVTSSATMIIAASAGMLLFPQGFLKSVAYGTIAAVLLAMISSLTVLPAILSILGRRVDSLSLKWINKTKTADEIENGYWGKMTAWVMKHPLKVAIPIVIGLLLLIIPVKNLQFGGISETYLPPDNPVRVAQEHFDEIFPLRKADPVQLVIVTDNSKDIGPILAQANKAPGLVKNAQFGIPSKPPNGSNVWVSEATVEDSAHPEDTVDYLRSMEVPDSAEVMVTGQPVMMMDSIDSLLAKMPLMIALVLFITTVLMFLTFGSLVLPLKAALMSALGLGSTLGILTWIFIDGHGASLLNFTPQPIMSPVLVLIIAIIYGLSIDYEVFLLSRMVEARTQGASTTEAVRIGTAQTGRIITAAALILLVVTGAFAFSDLVMMQYIAYGMVAALFIDATVLRMLLVPATMKLLGDDCWWAPAWMKKIQQKIGLGEPILDDERPGGEEVVDLVKTTPITDPVTMQIPMLADGSMPRSRKPRRTARKVDVDSEAPTQALNEVAPATPAAAPGTPSGPAHPAPPSESANAGFTGSPTSANAGFATPSAPANTGFTAPSTPAKTGFAAKSDGPHGVSDFTAFIGTATGAATGDPAAESGAPHSPAAGVAGADSGAPQRVPAPPAPAAGVPPRSDRAADGAFTQPGFGTPAGQDVGVRPGTGVTEQSTSRGQDGAFAQQGGPAAPQGPVPAVSQPGSAAPQADPQSPPAPAQPVAGAERVLPPPSMKVPPHPATRAQLYQPHAEPTQPVTAAESDATQPVPTQHAQQEAPQGGGRNSIEQWMSDLRSARRRPGKDEEDDDEGKHRGGEGRTVSVNELLRRQNRD